MKERKDKRVRHDMRVNNRVEAVKISQTVRIIRVERRVEIRINPLKAVQVVDFQDIETNGRASMRLEFHEYSRNEKDAEAFFGASLGARA